MKSIINKFHFQKLALETGVWGVLEQTELWKGKLAGGKLSGFVFITLFILFGECGRKQELEFLVNWESHSNCESF